MAFFAAANEETQQIGREQRHEDAAAVEQEEHQGGMVGEESEGEDGVDRQSGGARHEGQGDHREQAALAVLDGAGGHDGRHVATETGEHREERFAVQSHASQNRVEKQGGACQIARILENRDEEIENQDLGQEDDHGAYTTHHAGSQQIGEPPIFGEGFGEGFGEPCHAILHPVHRILPDGERRPEDQQNDGEEKTDRPRGFLPKDGRPTR